jgi:WS/DGAT/MGAT family acyltransferase
MGAVDAIWLHMDRPENLLVIDALFWCDGKVEVEAVQNIWDRVVKQYPVFGQRAVEPSLPFGVPHWEDDPDFDVSEHVVQTRLPRPGGDAELRAYVEEQMRRPLDRSRPLWEAHVIHGYRAPGSPPRSRLGSVVMTRIHHAVADGIALASVLISLTDPVPDAADVGQRLGPKARTSPARGKVAAARPAAATPSGISRLPVALARTAIGGLHILADLPKLVRPGGAVDALALAGQVGQAAAEQVGHAVEQVGHAVEQVGLAAEAATHTAGQVGHVADKLLLATLPPSPFSVPPGEAKYAVWSTAHDLSVVKAIGRATGSTVNDVLLTAVGRSLQEYMLYRGADPVDLTALVPVNVRPAGAVLPKNLGNKFALVFLPLPSGAHGRLERLSWTKKRMDEIKSSPEAAITFGVMSAVGRSGADIERLLVDFFTAKAIGVLTNVAGPPTPRFFAGVPMSGVLGWVPQAAGQTLGVCIFSYAGTVRVGFRVDANAVPEPELLVASFDAALAELAEASGG